MDKRQVPLAARSRNLQPEIERFNVIRRISTIICKRGDRFCDRFRARCLHVGLAGGDGVVSLAHPNGHAPTSNCLAIFYFAGIPASWTGKTIISAVKGIQG